MATLYFTTNSSARLARGVVAPAGNYYILGMSGFTCIEEVFKTAIAKKHRHKIDSMWLQYNDKKVVCLINKCEVHDSELSDFAQAKLTASKWGDKLEDFPYGSARFLGST